MTDAPTTIIQDAPTIDDFTNWTPADDDAAIRQAATTFNVKHVIKNRQYWALVPGGRIYKLPLALSLDDYGRFMGAQNDLESIDGLRTLLNTFSPSQAAQIAAEPIQVLQNLLTDYAGIIVKTQGVSLGESTTSTENSSQTTGRPSAPTSPATDGASPETSATVYATPTPSASTNN